MKNPVSAKDYAKQRAKQGCSPPDDIWFPSGHYCEGIQCVTGELAGGARRRGGGGLGPAEAMC